MENVDENVLRVKLKSGNHVRMLSISYNNFLYFFLAVFCVVFPVVVKKPIRLSCVLHILYGFIIKVIL